MTNAIVVLIVLLIVGGAGYYVYREKKKGVKCIGCPAGNTCGGNCSGCGDKR